MLTCKEALAAAMLLQCYAATQETAVHRHLEDLLSLFAYDTRIAATQALSETRITDDFT